MVFGALCLFVCLFVCETRRSADLCVLLRAWVSGCVLDLLASFATSILVKQLNDGACGPPKVSS